MFVFCFLVSSFFNFALPMPSIIIVLLVFVCLYPVHVSGCVAREHYVSCEIMNLNPTFGSKDRGLTLILLAALNSQLLLS